MPPRDTPSRAIPTWPCEMEVILERGHARDEAADGDAEREERDRDRGPLAIDQSAGSSSKVACSPGVRGSPGLDGLTVEPYLTLTYRGAARASFGLADSQCIHC